MSTAKIGDFLTFDDNYVSRGLIASDWAGAEFQLISNTLAGHVVSCNVEITGRTPRKVSGGYAIRCKVTFVHDGEANEVCRGWLWPHDESAYQRLSA